MEVQVIEDIIAQSQTVVDSLTYKQGRVALAALRAIYDHPESPGPFAQLLGMNFEKFDSGRCTVSVDVKEHLLNPHGIAHGGVTFSLADSACGGAAVSAIGEPRVVTQDMLIRYHGPVRLGRITANARVIHQGQRTITIDCRVAQGDVLVASVTATFAILTGDELPTVKSNP
jgi:acyl-CoA thioesterase